MSLSEERLAEIADNLPPADADLSRRERDAHDLLAEVKRLRAGIESLVAQWFREGWYDPAVIEALRDDLLDLLNPTEGDRDE